MVWYWQFASGTLTAGTNHEYRLDFTQASALPENDDQPIIWPLGSVFLVGDKGVVSFGCERFGVNPVTRIEALTIPMASGTARFVLRQNFSLSAPSPLPQILGHAIQLVQLVSLGVGQFWQPKWFHPGSIRPSGDTFVSLLRNFTYYKCPKGRLTPAVPTAQLLNGRLSLAGSLAHF
jgi:hypothetical protein